MPSHAKKVAGTVIIGEPQLRHRAGVVSLARELNISSTANRTVWLGMVLKY
jgi:hypothetical protein